MACVASSGSVASIIIKCIVGKNKSLIGVPDQPKTKSSLSCFRIPSNVIHSRGYDSVIRRMKILVCSGIDFMCVFSTFALKLEDK